MMRLALPTQYSLKSRIRGSIFSCSAGVNIMFVKTFCISSPVTCRKMQHCMRSVWLKTPVAVAYIYYMHVSMLSSGCCRTNALCILRGLLLVHGCPAGLPSAVCWPLSIPLHPFVLHQDPSILPESWFASMFPDLTHCDMDKRESMWCKWSLLPGLAQPLHHCAWSVTSWSAIGWHPPPPHYVCAA